MDLTQYSSSPYAPGGKSFGTQVKNSLAAVLRGALGAEEPGSVMDPGTAEYRALNDKAQLASILSDLTPGKALAGAAAKGVMLAGALRRGGRPDLFLSHGTTLDQLLRSRAKLDSLIPELTHPSMAITRNSPTSEFGDITFVARPDVFDPRHYPAVLHSRDAWTPAYNNSLAVERVNTGRQFSNAPTLQELAALRLRDRFEHRFPQGGLNAVGDGTVIGARRFPNFKAYENSPQSNALIDQAMMAPEYPAVDAAWAKINELSKYTAPPRKVDIAESKVLQQIAGGKFNARARDELTAEQMQAATTEARAQLKALRELPQSYAELKAFGHVPITGSSFSHALINDVALSNAGFKNNKTTRDKLFRAFENRGIQPYTYTVDDDAQMLSDIVNMGAFTAPRGGVR